MYLQYVYKYLHDLYILYLNVYSKGGEEDANRRQRNHRRRNTD